MKDTKKKVLRPEETACQTLGADCSIYERSNVAVANVFFKVECHEMSDDKYLLINVQQE